MKFLFIFFIIFSSAFVQAHLSKCGQALKMMEATKQLENAVLLNKLTSIQRALSAGADIHFVDVFNNTFLHYAVLNKKLEPQVVRILLQKDIDVNHQNQDGKTALDLTQIQQVRDLLKRYGAKSGEEL